MGYAISWLAVKDETPELVLQKLGLVPSDKMADHERARFKSRALPSEWFLVVMEGCDHKFIKPKSLALVSKNCDVVACSIEEHVMFSSAEQWTNGTRVWRAEHIGENGGMHLDTAGALPRDFQTIVEAQSALQRANDKQKAEVHHYIDIPLIAARNIVGFKHDEPEFERGSFEVLESREKKAWWKPW
jgi:hypothetical protein